MRSDKFFIFESIHVKLLTLKFKIFNDSCSHQRSLLSLSNSKFKCNSLISSLVRSLILHTLNGTIHIIPNKNNKYY